MFKKLSIGIITCILILSSVIYVIGQTISAGGPCPIQGSNANFGALCYRTDNSKLYLFAVGHQWVEVVTIPPNGLAAFTNLIVGALSVTDLTVTTINGTIPGAYNYHNSVFMIDDFPADNNTTGQIGEWSWQKTATASVVGTTAIANDFSIVDLQTGAVANQNNTIYTNTSGVFNFDSAENPAYNVITDFRIYAVNGGVQGGNSAVYRVGWGSPTPVANPPNTWFGVEALATDNNWFCVSKVVGVTSRVDTGVVIGNSSGLGFSFDIMRVVRTPTGLTCSVNNSTAVSILSNMTALGQSPFFQVVNNAAATVKDMEIDYMAITITGLTR